MSVPTMPIVPKAVEAEDQIPILLSELNAWFGHLKRSTVGFNTLRLSFLSATGALPEGSRKSGLPLFEYTGALHGKESSEAVKCVLDLKHLPPKYVAHVLIPLANVHGLEILEALDEIDGRIQELRPLLTKIVSPAAEGDKQPE